MPPRKQPTKRGSSGKEGLIPPKGAKIQGKKGKMDTGEEHEPPQEEVWAAKAAKAKPEVGKTLSSSLKGKKPAPKKTKTPETIFEDDDEESHVSEEEEEDDEQHTSDEEEDEDRQSVKSLIFDASSKKNQGTMGTTNEQSSDEEVEADTAGEAETAKKKPQKKTKGKEAQVPDGDGESSSKSKKKGKRSAKSVREWLTQDTEDELIDWIKNNPMLWDKTLNEYRNKQKKNALWEEKAKEVHLTKDELYTWYDSLRTRYGRLLLTKSGDGSKPLTDREQWILRNFEFVKGQITRQPSRQSCNVSSFFLYLVL